MKELLALLIVIAAIFAAQSFVLMTATAFLAHALGIGAALSFGESALGALLIMAAKLVFSTPDPKRL